MVRSWLISSRGLAKTVINAGQPAAAHQIQDCGANTRCPNCLHRIDSNDVSQDWPGLPAGVKFDPSDVQLLEHLAAKRGVGKSDSHVFIDEFIPTLEDKEGICYTHPENLPGAKKDGSSVHFFYRIRSAYASGRRKRRRIQEQDNSTKPNMRWHKTGKTKPVMQNGIVKGFKKIMVLYGAAKMGSKPEKCNWVMHQFHLGTDEEETEGEFVVSKIFYQPDKATDTNAKVKEELDVKTVEATPMTTPQTTTPYSDCLSEHYYPRSLPQETEHLIPKGYSLCNEMIGPYEDANASYGIGDLLNLEFDTAPEFQNLQFDSQDSVFGSLDQL